MSTKKNNNNIFLRETIMILLTYAQISNQEN